MARRENGTVVRIGANGRTQEKKTIAAYNPIVPAKAYEVNLPFNAFLTFGVYNGMPVSFVEYCRQVCDPRAEENKGKITIVSPPMDLVRLLKREELLPGEKEIFGKDYLKKHGVANVHVVNNTSNSNERGIAMGITDIYKLLMNYDPNIEKLLSEEVSRDQFQIAVPEKNKHRIELTSGDTTAENSLLLFLSPDYMNKINDKIGLKQAELKRGDVVTINHENLSKLDNKVVVGFGSYIPNKERRILMYITPTSRI